MLDGNILLVVVVIASVLLSITVHEAMHAYAADWLGDDTARLQGRLTLNPLSHIDPFATVLLPVLLTLAGLPPFGAAKPVPFNPARLRYDEFGAAIVGAAGPLTNLTLAAVTAAVLEFFGGVFSGFVTDVLVVFAAVNVGFFVFNTIPFPPLDGSRVLYAFAPQPLQELMQRIEGLGLVGILIFFFVLFPFVRPVMELVYTALLNFLMLPA